VGWLPAALLILTATCALPARGQHRTIVCEGSAPQSIRPQPHVEIFRGLGGYMPGSEGLQERLAARGISSTTSCNVSAHCVARRILERRARGDQSPIVLMGYAVGGGGTRKVAKDLAENGVRVDAVILIDPSFFEPVPRNVRYCFVAYKPEVWNYWNPIQLGHPVRVESTETVVNRVNLEETAPPGVLEGECHLTITTNEWIQEILVHQAAAVFGLDGDERQGSRCRLDETTGD
jgi:hypothetical protein